VEPVKTLVVYYTRTGNSKFAAEIIATELGADLEEIVDLKNRQGKFSFLRSGKDAGSAKETQITPIKKIPNDYDLLIIVQPIWNRSPTPAIRTYINKYNLSGKKVALFFSDSSIGLGKAIKKTKALMPNSTFFSELDISAKGFKSKEEAKKKIVEWCNTQF
jgi:flavodoxin